MKTILLALAILALVALVGISAVDAYPVSYYSYSYSSYSQWLPYTGWVSTYSFADGNYYARYYGYTSPWGW